MSLVFSSLYSAVKSGSYYPTVHWCTNLVCLILEELRGYRRGAVLLCHVLVLR